MRSRAIALRAPNNADSGVRGPFSARWMLSATVWLSKTVGFWNLRPMPSSAISVSSSIGQVVAARE